MVPENWTLNDGPTFAAHPPWVEIAEQIAASGDVVLEKCGLRADQPQNPEEVCVLGDPAIAVGGNGHSSDPFNNMAAPCQPDNTNDVFGCDVPAEGASGSGQVLGIYGATAPAYIAEDMETAAICSEALAHGLPFIAFRAVSDGAGDPLNLMGAFRQFFVYYRLAADNAAAAAVAFVEHGAPRATAAAKPPA